MALCVSSNLPLKICLTAEMLVSALDQTVKHREKGKPESYDSAQEPHGKPDLSVVCNFSSRGGFHVGSNFPIDCLQGWGSQTL
jgi:hypothetical protein